MTGNPDGGRAEREAHEAIDRAMTAAHYTHAEAREAECWFDADRVASEPATTAWKRLARWRQARWRDAQGYPIGSDPLRGGLRAKRVGSRIALDFARESGANLVTPQALAAARGRLALPEPARSFDVEALWADLLSPSALSFNLFGTLAGSAAVAERAVAAWWPKLAHGSVSLRFEHSPSGHETLLLGGPDVFNAAFEVEGSAGSAILGVNVKYHEHAAAEPAPDPDALARQVAVAERSGVFRRGWQPRVIGTGLQRIWQEHLLVLSLLQHPARHWTHGCYVLVYPALNPSFAAAVLHYRELLSDFATFETTTIEGLLHTQGALDRATRDVVQARYT